MNRPKPPQTVAALVAAIDQIVTAIDGPARAWFQVGPERVVYQVWKVGAVGSPEDMEPLLCMWFWANFLTAFTQEMIEDDVGLLFWRSRPQLTTWVNSKGQDCVGIRARFACPGVEFPFGAARLEGDNIPYLN